MSTQTIERLNEVVAKVVGATNALAVDASGWDAALATVGLAVAVAQGNATPYTQCYGVREFGKAAPIDSDTLFQIGSTTKAFTAAALGILADEDKLWWDDRLVDHLPTFQVQDTWLTQNLTIRDALAHRSGIPDDIYYPFLAVMDSEVAICQLRNSIADGSFRDSYRYNNLLYAVTGKIVERVSGCSWNDFIKQRLFLPLRMNRSGTSPYDFWNSQYVAATFLGRASNDACSFEYANDGNVAMPHAWAIRHSVAVLPWQSYDTASAAGAIVSSAADIANWLVLNLNGGKFDGRQILRPRTLAELHTTQNGYIDVDHFPFGAGAEGYALGWRTAQYRGHQHLAHGGGIIGFPAYVALLPDAGIGVAVLSNGPQQPWHRLGLHRLALHKAIAFSVFDHLLGAPCCDWVGEFSRRAQAAQLEAQEQELNLRRSHNCDAKPTLPIERYAGVYEDVGQYSGRINICVENGELTLNFAGEGAYSAALKHWYYDSFRVESNPGAADVLGPQFLNFVIDSTGRVASMTAFDTTFHRIERIH